MATLYKEFIVGAPVDVGWDALRDFGAVHERVAKGFVSDCRMEGDVRVLTFANGVTAREALVGIHESAKRLCYCALDGKAAHRNASAQVFPHSWPGRATGPSRPMSQLHRIGRTIALIKFLRR